MRIYFLFVFLFVGFGAFAQMSLVEEAQSMMMGSFDSSQQAETDTTYYNINLVMHPIWEDDSTAAWLYVEQALSTKLLKPYRQRVYKITQANDSTVESAVFTLPHPEAFVHAWENDSLFNTLQKDSLAVRQGCSVFLVKQRDGSYSGSTHEKDCQSTLYGASYATSIVSIYADRVVSWDQGWDDKDQYVWGAEKAGYVFMRKEEK